MAIVNIILSNRGRYIIKKYKEKGSISEDKALSFKEAGIIFPNQLNQVKKRLIKNNILVKTNHDRYYLNIKNKEEIKKI